MSEEVITLNMVWDKLSRIEKHLQNTEPYWINETVWTMEQCLEFLGCKESRFYEIKKQYGLRKASRGKYFSRSLKRAKEKLDRGLDR